MFYINLFIYLIGLLFRNIISIPVNIILSLLLVLPSNRQKIKEFKYKIYKEGIRITIDNFYRYDFKYNWFFILFTIHPVFVVLFKKGDCLNYCCFVRWVAKQKSSDSDIRIYEIFSKKPFIRKNHAFCVVDSEIYTPYWHTKAQSITYFEKLMKAEYYRKYLDLSYMILTDNITID